MLDHPPHQENAQSQSPDADGLVTLENGARVLPSTARLIAERDQPAHELIGHEGQFRLPGGRQVYDAVLFNDNGRTTKIRLAYLAAKHDGIKQVNRYVDWDQPIEVIIDYDRENQQ